MTCKFLVSYSRGHEKWRVADAILLVKLSNGFSILYNTQYNMSCYIAARRTLARCRLRTIVCGQGAVTVQYNEGHTAPLFVSPTIVNEKFANRMCVKRIFSHTIFLIVSIPSVLIVFLYIKVNWPTIKLLGKNIISVFTLGFCHILIFK